jgi:hypothetical protein
VSLGAEQQTFILGCFAEDLAEYRHGGTAVAVLGH